jgi:hypothetical protein
LSALQRIILDYSAEKRHNGNITVLRNLMATNLKESYFQRCAVCDDAGLAQFIKSSHFVEMITLEGVHCTKKGKEG